MRNEMLKAKALARAVDAMLLAGDDESIECAITLSGILVEVMDQLDAAFEEIEG